MPSEITLSPISDPQIIRRLERLARKEGKTIEQVAEEVTHRALVAMIGEGDLTPNECCQVLSIHKNTFFSWAAKGLFPGMYYINARVCRVPMKDVMALKDRTVFVK